MSICQPVPVLNFLKFATATGNILLYVTYYFSRKEFLRKINKYVTSTLDMHVQGVPFWSTICF